MTPFVEGLARKWDDIALRCAHSMGLAVCGKCREQSIVSAVTEALEEAEKVANTSCPSCRGTDPKCGGMVHQAASLIVAHIAAPRKMA